MTPEELIDSLMDVITDYVDDSHRPIYIKETTFTDVESALKTALADVWKTSYDLGVRDQLASESTPGYSPSRTNPYKKETND